MSKLSPWTLLFPVALLFPHAFSNPLSIPEDPVGNLDTRPSRFDLTVTNGLETFSQIPSERPLFLSLTTGKFKPEDLDSRLAFPLDLVIDVSVTSPQYNHAQTTFWESNWSLITYSERLSPSLQGCRPMQWPMKIGVMEALYKARSVGVAAGIERVTLMNRFRKEKGWGKTDGPYWGFSRSKASGGGSVLVGMDGRVWTFHDIGEEEEGVLVEPNIVIPVEAS